MWTGLSSHGRGASRSSCGYAGNAGEIRIVPEGRHAEADDAFGDGTRHGGAPAEARSWQPIKIEAALYPALGHESFRRAVQDWPSIGCNSRSGTRCPKARSSGGVKPVHRCRFGAHTRRRLPSSAQIPIYFTSATGRYHPGTRAGLPPSSGACTGARGIHSHWTILSPVDDGSSAHCWTG